MNGLIEPLISASSLGHISKVARACSAAVIISLTLFGCGDESGGGLLGANPSPDTSQPPMSTPPVGPAPTQPPQPTRPPQSPAPEAFRIASTQSDDEMLYVTWTDARAVSYRLLYWQGNNAPIAHSTTQLSFAAAAPPEGDYTVLVEAYDALGNSIFSAPQFVEVLP